MQMPGPIPKRSDERRRRNKPEGGMTAAPGAAHVEVPPASSHWHPMARDWYLSLAKSGQSSFYQPSDWETARVWAEVLSQQLSGSKISAMTIQAWSSASAELMTTEGARRRGRLELERSQGDADQDASVTMLSAYRAKFAS